MSPNIFWLDIPHLAFWHQTMIKFSTAIKALSEVSWDGGEQWSKCCKGWNFWHSVRNLLWKLETSRCSWIIRSTQGEKKNIEKFPCWLDMLGACKHAWWNGMIASWHECPILSLRRRVSGASRRHFSNWFPVDLFGSCMSLSCCSQNCYDLITQLLSILRPSAQLKTVIESTDWCNLLPPICSAKNQNPRPQNQKHKVT